MILAATAWLRARDDWAPRPDRTVPLRYEPMAFGPVEGARLVGAWRPSAADPRFGGLSGAAWEKGRLVAISDAGTVMRFDLPGTANPRLSLHDLPAVPGPPGRKLGRDSEALLRDPSGDGWWVAFEQRHSLFRYDRDFTKALEVVRVRGDTLSDNRGIEALYTTSRGRLVPLAESTGASDATRTIDGRLVILERKPTARGMRSALLLPDRRIELPFGPIDNPEAIAAAPLMDGGTRLWILTDSNFSPWQRMMLVAIDLPAADRKSP